MSSILEKMKEQFRDDIAELIEHNCELSGHTFYYRAKGNGAQTDKSLGLIQEGKVEGHVLMIIDRALNKDGGKLFKLQDKKELMTDCDPKVLVSWGNTILLHQQRVEAEELKRAADTAKK